MFEFGLGELTGGGVPSHNSTSSNNPFRQNRPFKAPAHSYTSVYIIDMYVYQSISILIYLFTYVIKPCMYIY